MNWKNCATLALIYFAMLSVPGMALASYPQTQTTNFPWVNLHRPKDDPRWAEAFSHWDKRADTNEVEAAIVIAEQIVADNPQSFDGNLWLCRMNFMMAMRKLRKRNEYCDKAIKAGDQALNIKPGDDIARNWRFSAMLLRRELTEEEYAEVHAIARKYRHIRHIPTPSDDPLWAEAIKKYDSRSDIDQAKAAIEDFKKLEAKYPDRIEPKIYLAMTFYWLGENVTHRKASANLHKIGADWGARAVEIEPRSAAANYAFGVTLGQYSMKTGMSAMVNNGMDMAKAITLVVEEDPTYMYGGFSRYIAVSMAFAGQLSLRITGLLGFPKALILRVAAFSTRLEPACLENQLSLAIMYYSFKRKEEARVLFEKVINGNPEVLKYYEPENRNSIKTAREMYEKQFGKK